MTKSETADGKERYIVASCVLLALPLVRGLPRPKQRRCRSAGRTQLAFPMCKKPSHARRGLQTRTCSSSCC